MASADPSCPRLCGDCRRDCICEDDGCRMCCMCQDIRYLTKGKDKGMVMIDDGCRVCLQLEWGHSEAKKTRAKMLTFPQLFDSGTIEIRVGGDGAANQRTRFVPKNLLIENSDFFKSYFSFSEKIPIVLDEPGPKTPITLNDEVDKPEAFDRFIQYAYWKDYVASEEDHDTDIAIHAQVYALAERLQATGLKDLSLRKAGNVADRFSKRILAKPTKTSNGRIRALTCLPRAIKVIYGSTPSRNDPFRALIAALSASCPTAFKHNKMTGLEECVRNIPDFAVDLFNRTQYVGKELEVDADGYLRC